MGEPVRFMIDLPQDHKIATLNIYQEQGQSVLATAKGLGFIIDNTQLLAQTRQGKQIAKVDAKDKIAIMKQANHDHVALLTSDKRLLVFKTDTIAKISGITSAKGVILMKLNPKNTKKTTAQLSRSIFLTDIACFNLVDGLNYYSANGQKSFTLKEDQLRPFVQQRGKKGNKAPVGFPANNRFNHDNWELCRAIILSHIK